MTDNVIPFPVRPAATPKRATVHGLSSWEVMYLRARFAHLGPWFTEPDGPQSALVNAVLLLDRNAEAHLESEAKKHGFGGGAAYLDSLVSEALYNFLMFMEAITYDDMPPLIAPDHRVRLAPQYFVEEEDDGIPF